MRPSIYSFNYETSPKRLLSGFRFCRNIIVGVALLTAGFVVTTKVISIYSQSNYKSIAITPDGVVKPQITIKELEIGGRNIKSNETFAESSDWLSRVSFTVENVSEKPIKYMLIHLWLPETKVSGSVMVYQIVYGNLNPSKAVGPAFLLDPGAKTRISLANEYSKIEAFVSPRHSMANIQKTRLEVGFLLFDDETAWSAGTFLKRDSKAPNRFIPQE